MRKAVFLTGVAMMMGSVPAQGSVSEASQGPTAPTTAAAAADPFQWLEEVEGERALDWARTENQRTLGLLQSDPRY